MYADAFGLLVFGPLLTSASLSKNKFLDKLRPDLRPVFFLQYCLCQRRVLLNLQFQRLQGLKFCLRPQEFVELQHYARIIQIPFKIQNPAF